MKRKTKRQEKIKLKMSKETFGENALSFGRATDSTLPSRHAPWRVISASMLLCFWLMYAPVSVFAQGNEDLSSAGTTTEVHSAQQITNELEQSEARYGEQGGNTSKLEYKLTGVSNKNINAYSKTTTIVNGKHISTPSLTINGISYLPLRAVSDALGAGRVSYDSASRSMTISGNGLELSVTDGGFVMYANGRALFSFSPCVIMSNGRMYVPASAFAKSSGTRLSVSGDVLRLEGAFSPLSDASSFYRDDEVIWLARMISAEAKGESLIGQIAVGNVIMNRVRSPLYPNTIWGVIFDRRYGVQFSPVLNGTVYDTPTYTAILAARICLEGTVLSDDSLFFVNPRKAPNSWIAMTRVYAYTIGNHDFYY